MTYETETTKTMSNRELAEAIVDDRLSCGQFSEGDRDWLVERELRETRESLVSGFNAIERWSDTDDEIAEEDAAPRRVFDGDFGQLFGDWAWQYDMDAVTDMMTEIDWSTGARYWKCESEMPTMEEIEACQWTPITENVPHLLDWYCSYDEPDICDVDEDKVLAALSEVGDDGEMVWKPLCEMEVASVISDNALVTSDNMGTWAADDMSAHLDDMWEVVGWIGADSLMTYVDDEEDVFGRILDALTDEHDDWKCLTRAEAYGIVDDIIRG